MAAGAACGPATSDSVPGSGPARVEQHRHVALDLLELVQLQIGIEHREDIARFGMFVDKDALVVAENLFLDLEQTFAFQHDGQDVNRRPMDWVVFFDQFAEQGFRCLPWIASGAAAAGA